MTAVSSDRMSDTSIIIRTERVPLDQLTPFPGNPRRGNIAAIMNSLAAFGQFRAIVANQATGHILGGNHTWHAARELDWTDIEVSWVDVPEDDEGKIVAADNRTADLGDYDDAALLALLQDLDDLEATGWTQHERDRLEADLGKLAELDKQPIGDTPTPPDTPDTPDKPDKTADPDFANSEQVTGLSRNSEDQATVRVQVGRFRFDIGRGDFDEWDRTITAANSASHDAIILDIRNRLGL